MGRMIDSDKLLISLYNFCRHCHETTHGFGYDPEPCHNDLCPMKFVVGEIGRMQIEQKQHDTTDCINKSTVSINKQNGSLSNTYANDNTDTANRRCKNCGSYWHSRYCCICGAETEEVE